MSRPEPLLVHVSDADVRHPKALGSQRSSGRLRWRRSGSTRQAGRLLRHLAFEGSGVRIFGLRQARALGADAGSWWDGTPLGHWWTLQAEAWERRAPSRC